MCEARSSGPKPIDFLPPYNLEVCAGQSQPQSFLLSLLVSQNLHLAAFEYVCSVAFLRLLFKVFKAV